MFRLANERASEWEERHADAEAELYACECSNRECRERMSLRRADYEKVRADAGQFVLIPGHEVPDVETVIERQEGWVIVEKAPEVRETVERFDLR
jgi:hypothetical protein